VPRYGVSDARIIESRQWLVSSSDDILRFIGSSFRSVWALELLLLLKREPRTWSQPELVSTLRASELVVSKALEDLVAAGLASTDGEGASYMPVNQQVGRYMDEVEQLYRARPNSVRHAIISASTRSATAFAEAFRLRKD
jgi:hypothetical protein